MYKIILADDHAILRTGLRSLLAKDRDFLIVAEAQDGQQLLDVLESNKCDLLITDISMPNMDGIQALKAIHGKYPKMKILVLTMQKDEEHFRHAVKNGANSYVLKEDAYDELIVAVRATLNGKRFISPAIANVIAEGAAKAVDAAENSSLAILTSREKEVLKFVAQGLPNKSISTKLKISIRTVEAHRANITKKLGLKNTASLVKYAINKGII